MVTVYRFYSCASGDTFDRSVGDYLSVIPLLHPQRLFQPIPPL